MKNWRELLPVAAILTTLAALALPARGQRHGTSRALECLSNKRLLIQAWTAFANDHDARLPGVAVNAPSEGASRDYPWVTGYLNWDDNDSNTNTLKLTTAPDSFVGPYLSGKYWAYRCPADNYVSQYQAAFRGWTSRARSVSASSMIGAGNGWNPSDQYVRVTLMSEFITPGPALTYVFLDEHPDYLQDGTFVSPDTGRFLDAPAGHHGGAGSLVFADGHAELKLWVENTAPPVSAGASSTPPVGNSQSDMAWLRDRTPRAQ